MIWMLMLSLIVAGEHLAHPFLSGVGTWELALSAKYLAVAVVLQALLGEIKKQPISYRSLVALFCIGAWVDVVGQAAWNVWRFDSSLPVMILFSVWLIVTVKREYNVTGDMVLGDNFFVMLLRPESNLAVCKALVGFPAASVCIYARGDIWSFRAKTGMFDIYPVTDAWLRRHIAINTGAPCNDDLQQMLNNLCGQRRFPGTKCVWAIRYFLKKLGPEYAPRWCDYIPGIYAMRLLRKGM